MKNCFKDWSQSSLMDKNVTDTWACQELCDLIVMLKLSCYVVSQLIQDLEHGK